MNTRDGGSVLRAPGNYDVDRISNLSAIDFMKVDEVTGELVKEVSLTQQEFKDECDINEIVRRFGLTGQLPDNYRAPVSGDFTGISDFKTAMDAVRAAQDRFMEMPAELRARFDNDPQKLIGFLDDEKNREEAIKLGILNKPPEVTRDAVKAIDDLAAVLKPKPAA